MKRDRPKWLTFEHGLYHSKWEPQGFITVNPDMIVSITDKESLKDICTMHLLDGLEYTINASRAQLVVEMHLCPYNEDQSL
jgi:hypothetical protein